MSNDLNFVPMIQILRNNHLESIHLGSAIVIGPDNDTIIEWGDTNMKIFPRSAMKIILFITKTNVIFMCAFLFSQAGRARHLLDMCRIETGVLHVCTYTIRVLTT